MEYSEKFKLRFLDLVSDLDCKKSQIHKILNIDYNVYIKITEFGVIPKPTILMRIADYFNISIEYLLARSNEVNFYKSEKPVEFLDRYNALKIEYNLTDYAIAQKLHITTSYTTNWKKKKYFPSIINIIELSEIFHVSIDYLLGRTDDKTIYK